MKKNSKILKWVVFLLLIVAIVFGVIVGKYRLLDQRYVTNTNVLIRQDRIESDYSRKQYSKAITQSELEYKLKTTAARLSLFMTTMIELDTENKVFTDTQFTDGMLYCDWVIYGDEMIDASNNLEGKILIMNNAISVINTNIDDINVFIYSLGNNKISYEYIWKDLNSDIQKLNKLIEEYNYYEKTKFIKLSEIKNIYPNISRKEKNRIKILFKEGIK